MHELNNDTSAWRPAGESSDSVEDMVVGYFLKSATADLLETSRGVVPAVSAFFASDSALLPIVQDVFGGWTLPMTERGGAAQQSHRAPRRFWFALGRPAAELGVVMRRALEHDGSLRHYPQWETFDRLCRLLTSLPTDQEGRRTKRDFLTLRAEAAGLRRQMRLAAPGLASLAVANAPTLIKRCEHAPNADLLAIPMPDVLEQVAPAWPDTDLEVGGDDFCYFGDEDEDEDEDERYRDTLTADELRSGMAEWERLITRPAHAVRAERSTAGDRVSADDVGTLGIHSTRAILMRSWVRHHWGPDTTRSLADRLYRLDLATSLIEDECPDWTVDPRAPRPCRVEEDFLIELARHVMTEEEGRAHEALADPIRGANPQPPAPARPTLTGGRG